MRIKKVKITKENKIMMVYEQEAKMGGWDEYAFTCSEEARPEFYEVMGGIASHVVDMCELPDNYLKRITVRGVSFSYGGDAEVMGATISASMNLDYSYQELNINTPHKASAMYSADTPEDEKQLLSGECIDALERLQDECRAYIGGERAQVKLFKAAS